MNRQKTYRWIIALVAIALTIAVWSVRRSEAIIIVNNMPAHFGALSLARGQALRFYLANAAMADPSTAPQPCVADIMVYDMMGNMVKSSRLHAAAGETAFFDVFFDVFTRMPAQNKVVFRLMAEVQPPDPNMPLGQCIGTAEVFNRGTGKTEVFLGGPDTIPARNGGQ